MRYPPLFCALLFTLAVSPTFAGTSAQKGYASQKGHAVACEPHCRKRCCHDKDRGSRNTRSADTQQRASGPVVEPVSMTGLVAIPVMSFRTMSLDSDSRSRSASTDQDDRIDEIDARVEALHLRLMTIQRSVELQTTILEELRDKGTIGGKPLGNSAVAPVAPVAPQADGTESDNATKDVDAAQEVKSAKEQLERAEKAVAAYLKLIENDPANAELKAQLEKVQQAIQAMKTANEGEAD